MSYSKLFLLAMLTVLLSGCPSTQSIPDPEPTDETYDPSADTDAMGGSGLGEGEDVPYDPSAGELTNVIYFDFDSSEVRPGDAATVARHATQLQNDSRLNVRLEGHADERGSREYNIGLGERRAQAVRRMLMIQGASAGQISTVSFGEERPASMGNDESAYAQNRRVEITYTN